MRVRWNERASSPPSLAALAVLEIERVDLECTVNNTEHHTELNGVDKLIVRRGQAFTVTLHLRPGSHFEHGNNINLIITTGSSLIHSLTHSYWLVSVNT